MRRLAPLAALLVAALAWWLVQAPPDGDGSGATDDYARIMRAE